MSHEERTAQGMKSQTTSRRGFVTIATGDSKYYQMALNLLHSYRLFGGSTYPFAIICDKDCPAAQEFDDIVLFDNPSGSFLDKLELYKYAPYEETIFIDADCLILRDTSVFWQDFSCMDDFSCYGRNLPLESREGWFYYKDMGALQSKIKHGIDMHGGVYYLRKTDRCRSIFERALELTKEYDQYVFYYFKKPADEPVLALSMVLCDCDPCPVSVADRVAVQPGNEHRFRLSVNGNLLLDKNESSAVVMHFGNRNVTRFMYRYLMKKMEYKLQGNEKCLSWIDYINMKLVCFPAEAKYRLKRLVRKSISQDTYNKLKKQLPQWLVRYIKK